MTWFFTPSQSSGVAWGGGGGGGGGSAERGGGDGLAVTADLAARTHSQPEGHSAGAANRFEPRFLFLKLHFRATSCASLMEMTR